MRPYCQPYEGGFLTDLPGYDTNHTIFSATILYKGVCLMVPSLRYYISGSFQCQEELRKFCEFFDSLPMGRWQVNSRWLLEEPKNHVSKEESAFNAQIDLEDVKQSDVFILTDTPSTRGGKWVELGYAQGLDKKIIFWDMQNGENSISINGEVILELPVDMSSRNPFLFEEKIQTVYSIGQLCNLLQKIFFDLSKISQGD